MTAINFIVRREAIHVISDGAQYAPDGTIKGFGSKVFPVPHLGAVIAARGNAHAAPMAAAVFGVLFRSFDDLLENLELAFEAFCEKHFQGDGSIQLHVGGYSRKREAFETGFITSHPDLAERNKGLSSSPEASIQPRQFTLVKKGVGLYSGPALGSGALMKAFGRPILSVDDITDLNIFARGLLELQREMRLGREVGLDEDHCWVGGFGMVTTLTCGSIESHIVCDWSNDLPNAYLDPDPIDWPAWRAANPLPARVADQRNIPRTKGTSCLEPPMNRAQRRALKKTK